jgi:hypothetical protein
MPSPIDTVLMRFPDAKRYRGRYAARCPVHQGAHRDSLSITEVGDGKVLLYCFGGCETAAVVRALGLEWGDLFAAPLTPAPRPTRPRRRPNAQGPVIPATPTPHATAATLYVALYLGAILADDLPTVTRDERMGCYLGLCEDLGRVYVDQGAEAARSVWDAWHPSLRHAAPALLAMLERGVR